MFPLVPVDIDSVDPNLFDSLVILSKGKDAIENTNLQRYRPFLTSYLEIDQSADSEAAVIAIPDGNSLIRRVVFSSVGNFDKDYDDSRRIYDAACKGIKRALKAGAKSPLLYLPSKLDSFPLYGLISLLGGLEALYVPIEVREAVPLKAKKVEKLGICNFPKESIEKTLLFADSLESGRQACRDIGGSDPERMAPPKVEEYVVNLFKGSAVNVSVVSEEAEIEKNYPLLAAVNRAARGHKRHAARVIFLNYKPEGPVDTTLVLVGKGVTYDTGGADIKAGGIMAGMHRDKCGSAAVAGFFQVLAKLKPKGIQVFGGMAMVRNSVGSDCYVADEIITSRAGKRVRVGNTDAEGRMAMADVLCHLKEKVLNEPNPCIFTIATLTGHACLTVGEGYSIVMENGPAKDANIGHSLQKAGDSIADMFEISTIRREDYEFHKGKSEYEDLLQCNNAPSSRTARGHQTPSAFLIMASGLDKHGKHSTKPLKYCHLDIAASSGPFPGIPSGAPIAALWSKFILNRF